MRQNVANNMVQWRQVELNGPVHYNSGSVFLVSIFFLIRGVFCGLNPSDITYFTAFFIYVLKLGSYRFFETSLETKIFEVICVAIVFQKR